ncbi:MAG: class I SAM-dependent methyltransferase, partial [Flavobacteriales bacterium]|nr:class I SAM-dependent methyltransferase [Flavobacteriales bacterium]
MMITLKRCPICNSEKTQNYILCKDYTVSQNNFQIVQCTNCQFRFTNPIPAQEEIGSYYESDEYISHSDTKKGLTNQLYHLVRNYTLKTKLDVVRKHTKPKSLLDYGCGTGFFLNYCKSQQISVTGVEPSEKGREYCKTNFQIDTLSPIQFSQETNKYDAITMWHVLEHVHELNDLISKLSTCINQNGILIIAVPNPNSLDAKIYKEHWAAYDVPRHLYHFSKENMVSLLEKHNFKFKGIYPMHFDSFYVSLLSEKYKTGSQRLLPAFFNGMRSNMSAIFSKNGFSSQIYAFS